MKRRVPQKTGDPDSANLNASCGATRNLHPDFGTTYDGVPWRIPYVTVRGNQPRVLVSFYYGDESDPGPYPILPDAPVESGPNSSGDRHDTMKRIKGSDFEVILMTGMVTGSP